MKEDQFYYVVTDGRYEDKENVLVTDSLDKAVTKFLNVRDPNTIEIWKDETKIHEYGMYTFDNETDYEVIYSNIKFIEQNGLEEYETKMRK
jgi:hypothetical protein